MVRVRAGFEPVTRRYGRPRLGLFVPARMEHRFPPIREPIEVLVIFARRKASP